MTLSSARIPVTLELHVALRQALTLVRLHGGATSEPNEEATEQEATLQ